MRALLFPISQSAFSSCTLIEEQLSHFKRLNHYLSHIQSSLPSPRESSGEKNGPASTRSARPLRSTFPILQTSEHSEKVPLLLLQQTPNIEKFTFGSSPHSDIVLKKLKSEPETCWVNLQHCALYPNPDDIGITLHNSSRCVFKVRRIEFGAEDSNKVVKPGLSWIISEGAWHLNLGEGFDFQINVLRHSKNWIDLHHALMKSVEISVPYQHQPSSAVQSRSEKSLTVRRNITTALDESRVEPKVPRRSHVDGRLSALHNAAKASHRCEKAQSSFGEAVEQITEGSDEHISIPRPRSPCTTALAGKAQLTRVSHRKDQRRGNVYLKNMKPISVTQESDLLTAHQRLTTAASTATVEFSAVDICGRTSLQNTTLGETATSRLIKRTITDGTVLAMKICRRPEAVAAAKSWRTEANILKSLNHVR